MPVKRHHIRNGAGDISVVPVNFAVAAVEKATDVILRIVDRLHEIRVTRCDIEIVEVGLGTDLRVTKPAAPLTPEVSIQISSSRERWMQVRWQNTKWQRLTADSQWGRSGNCSLPRHESCVECC